jgi:glutathione S-transferase
MTTSTSTRSVIPKFRFLSAWFCPYAHRATLALEHHSDRIDYEWVEALGWNQGTEKQEQQQVQVQQHDDKSKGTNVQKNDDDSNNNNNKVWYYHWKADELTRVNPSGLVPTIIPIINNQPDETKAMWESLITIDYIDSVAVQYCNNKSNNNNNTGTSTELLQDVMLNPIWDPYLAAKCRMWTEKVNKDCCSPYYGVLVRQDPIEQREHFDKIISGLVSFSQELDKTSGNLFLPNNQLSNVDIALIPWAYRYYVLEHYRGRDYTIPTIPELQPYHNWFEYVMKLPSVQRTLPDKDRYLDHIRKYADGTARSKVANAVRRGVAAHDFDDTTDEYDTK